MLSRSGKSVAHITLDGNSTVDIVMDIDLFRISEDDLAFVNDITGLARQHAALKAAKSSQRAYT